MKKLCLIIALVLCLTACGGAKEASTSGTTADKTEVSDHTSSETTTTVETRKFNIENIEEFNRRRGSLWTNTEAVWDEYDPSSATFEISDDFLRAIRTAEKEYDDLLDFVSRLTVEEYTSIQEMLEWGDVKEPIVELDHVVFESNHGWRYAGREQRESELVRRSGAYIEYLYSTNFIVPDDPNDYGKDETFVVEDHYKDAYIVFRGAETGHHIIHIRPLSGS